MPLVEDGELDSTISVEKRRTAREAVSAAAASGGVVPDSANVSRLIERLMRGYDKRLRPNYKGQPTRFIPLQWQSIKWQGAVCLSVYPLT